MITALLALPAGYRATFTFTGTAARWIGLKDPYSGIAKVYIDGVLQTQIDTYSASNQVNTVLYTTPALAPGTHTLTTEVAGTRNPSSRSNWCGWMPSSLRRRSWIREPAEKANSPLKELEE